MIVPLLTYAGPLKTYFTATQLSRLSSLHDRAKFVTKNTGIKNISNEISRQNCLFVKKCITKETSSWCFDNYFTIILNENRRTRNSGCLLRIPSVKLELSRSSFYFGAATLFNKLPLEIRAKPKTSEFRLALKGYNFL